MELCHCGQVAIKDGLCSLHFAIRVWTNNLDMDNLGIILFFKKFIPKAFKNFKYGIPKFHREMLWEVLRDERGWNVFNRKIVIAAPRGSSKTTLLSKGLVLFCAILGLKKYIVIASKTGRAAQKNLRWIRNALGSSIIISVFGDLRPKAMSSTRNTIDGVEGKWTSDILILTNGVTIEAVGMGQQLRSSAEGEEVNRIDLFIADDTETDENTKTPDRRETNETWLFDTVIPSLDLETGTIVFINTLTHTESILQKLLNSKAWRKKFYQITYIDESGREQPLWGEKFSVQIVDAIREDYKSTSREKSFYKEYYNLVRSDTGFNPKWIRYYHGEYFYQNGRNWIRFTSNYSDRELIVPCSMTLGIDNSYSYKDRSNDTVLLPLATIHDNRRFVLPYTKGKLSTFDDVDEVGVTTRKGIISEAIRLHEKYHFSSITIDASATQIGLYNQLKKAFAEIQHPPRIIPFSSTEEKYSRLRSLLEPEYEYGRIHHMNWMEDLYRELISFGDTTDDILDALYNAIFNAVAPAYIEYDPLLPPPGISMIHGRSAGKLKTNWMVL